MARWWIAALLTLLARDARADSVAEPSARITYSAPSECPDIEVFKAQVERRTPKFHEGGGPATLLLDVSLRVSGTVTTGTLDVTDARHDRSRRSLSGASCAEVAEAVALMAALAIDPLAMTRTPEPTPAAPPPPLPPPSLPPVAAAPPRSPVSMPPAAMDARAPSLVRPPAAATRRGGSFHVSLGVGVGATWGVVPVAMAEERAFVEMSREFRKTVGFRLRAGFARGAVGVVPLNGGAGSFRWTVGTLEGCPLQWKTGRFAFFPCLGIEAGQLEGVGADVIPIRDAARAWFAFAAPVHVRWTPVSPLSFDAYGGPRVPTTRYQFKFDPNIPAFQPSPVGPLLGVDVLVSFL